jgi:hypothetical protein
MSWEYKVIIVCLTISALSKAIILIIKLLESSEPKAVEEIPLNRSQRRHPNGKVPAQRFQRVSVPKQKQGNNRAIKNW